MARPSRTHLIGVSCWPAVEGGVADHIRLPYELWLKSHPVDKQDLFYPGCATGRLLSAPLGQGGTISPGPERGQVGQRGSHAGAQDSHLQWWWVSARKTRKGSRHIRLQGLSILVGGARCVWVLSKFNGTSTPKGSSSAKTGVNCTMSLSRVY